MGLDASRGRWTRESEVPKHAIEEESISPVGTRELPLSSSFISTPLQIPLLPSPLPSLFFFRSSLFFCWTSKSFLEAFSSVSPSLHLSISPSLAPLNPQSPSIHHGPPREHSFRDSAASRWVSSSKQPSTAPRDEADTRRSQEPDPATNARAVPIYATTVSQPGVLCLHASPADSYRASLSMTPPTAPGCLASRSLETSTAGS